MDTGNSTAKYIYALDSKGNIVCIDNVTEADRKLGFHCVSCGLEMTPALGKRNTHHFRHKGDTCSYESYLHKLGKKVLKEQFNRSKHFIIGYYANTSCEKSDDCKYFNSHPWPCDHEVLHKVDLKEYYDTCEEEVEYKGFRADLILKKQDEPNRSPVFIEISVTHDCDEVKLNSGIRIVEFKLKNEHDDLFRSFEQASNPQYKEKGRLPVRFYNFKRIVKAEPKPLKRFWISIEKDRTLMQEPMMASTVRHS